VYVFSTVTRVLESGPYLRAVVKIGVDDHSGHRSEREGVRNRIGHGNIHGGVGFVFVHEEVEVRINYTRNVVRFAGIVKCTRGQEWKATHTISFANLVGT